MIAGLSCLFLVVGVVSAVHYREPVTLHEKTCFGLWFPTVHLHGYCVANVIDRTNCSEFDRLFEVEDSRFDPVAYANVPQLVRLRALQEHALSNPRRQLCINRDTTFVEPAASINKCSAGFVYFNGNCYTATKQQVSYEEAQHQCSHIHGKLVGSSAEITENDSTLDFLLDLVKYYIKADIFTSYIQIDDSEHNVRDPLKEAHVEVDYETDRLQYVHSTEKRGFICVVKAQVQTQALPQAVALPSVFDELVVHDLNPLPPPTPDVERYLVDVLRFRCPGNYSNEGLAQHDVIRHRVDLEDLDAHFPYGCHYEASLGNVVSDLTNPRHKPKELKHVCKSLVPLYRNYDSLQRAERFGIHLPQVRPTFGGAVKEYDSNDAIGFCAQRKGDCGASIPLYNSDSKRPVCYVFPSHRNLNYELSEHRPLRYVQVANRLVNIYSSKHLTHKDYTVQSDPAADSNSTEPKLLGSVLSSLTHKDLDDYCRQHLVPLFKIRNLRHPNEFLVVQLHDVQEYRKNRDNYSAEELLGYCSTQPGYCGASLPLHQYTYRYEDGRRDDAYYNVEQLVGSDVNHQIPCYIF